MVASEHSLISIGDDLAYLDSADRGLVARCSADYAISDFVGPQCGTLDSFPVMFSL